MGDQHLRIWETDGDTYGDVKEYPSYAKYRYEPQYPGATGPTQTDLVIFEKAEDGDREMARFQLDKILMAFPGQPTPDPVLAAERERRTTETSAPRKTVKAGSPASSDKK